MPPRHALGIAARTIRTAAQFPECEPTPLCGYQCGIFPAPGQFSVNIAFSHYFPLFAPKNPLGAFRGQGIQLKQLSDDHGELLFRALNQLFAVFRRHAGA